MKKLFLYLLLCTNIILDGQSANLKLNSIDFSRYPNVDLFATITDKNGEPVNSELVKNSIAQLSQNRQSVSPTEVISVYDLKKKGETELYMALVFDNSKSMEKRNALLEDAAAQFVNGLTPGDRVSIIDFGDGLKTVRVPEFPEPIYAGERIGFSNSKNFLLQRVKTPVFTARTYMYDAILYALSVTHRNDVLGKKIVIFFSDGDNIGSQSNFDVVKKYSLEYDIPIYAIDLNIRTNSKLQDLAKTSGGEYFIVKEPKDLAPLYQSLLKMLKGQYRISYINPGERINNDVYSVNLTLDGKLKGSDYKTFKVEGEKIGYYHLAYLESEGKEKVTNYLDYLMSYPKSKYIDDVQMRLGNYWFTRGDYTDALGVYNKLLRNSTSSVYFATLAQKADLLIKTKDLAAAKKAYNQIVEGNASSTLKPKALLDLASLEGAEGNFITALDTYSKLTSDYEGTEWASEGLYQASLLNLKMGDLNQAAANLNKIVNDYSNSKSALYAQYELAKIAQKAGNAEEALGYYQKVMDSNIDADIKEQSSFESANILFGLGKFASAIPLLSSLAAGSSNLALVAKANELLTQSYIKIGDIFNAQSVFQSLPESQQAELLSQGEISAELPDKNIISLYNGTNMNSADESVLRNSIRQFDDEALRAKYPVLGPMYYFTVNSEGNAVNASIPVDKKWVNEKYIQRGKAGIYTYSSNVLQVVTEKFDPETLSFKFEVTNSGPYILLTERPIVITLENIYFDKGKATIRKDAERNLFKIIDMLKMFPEIKVEIAGHTDSTGTDKINTQLSLERAQSIRRFISKNGIDADRMKVRGYGSQYPVAPNDSEQNRQKNRRTEFIILSGLDELPTQNTSLNERYSVELESYTSLKQATEQKSFFNKRGYGVSVITDNVNGEVIYKLILGVYSSEDEAKDAAQKFISNFKQFDAKIFKL